MPELWKQTVFVYKTFNLRHKLPNNHIQYSDSTHDVITATTVAAFMTHIQLPNVLYLVIWH